MKSQPNEGICGSTERSEVLLGVLNVMLTLQSAPEAVNKSGCMAGFEVGIGEQKEFHTYRLEVFRGFWSSQHILMKETPKSHLHNK